MKKRRIVIASLLKPIDDTRMFEKMGVTFSDTGDYQVFIAGYPSSVKPVYPNIHFFALTSFKRISFGRLWAPFRIAQYIHQVKPDVLIVNTHELLIVGVLNRIFFGTRIIYDIQENYFRNILYSETFPKLLRPLLALWVRAKEKVTAPLFHWFYLAEKGYENEFTFFKNRFTIIENKAILPAGHKITVRSGYSQLLFSGTLAESTGVFEAIQLAIQLHHLNPSVRLNIIGYCSKAELLNKIKSVIKDHSFITLIGGNQLVPHQEIVNCIIKSDFGIISYPPSPHTQNSIPTKLYEYLSLQLPVIIQDKPSWKTLVQRCQGGISIDFKNFEVTELLEKMKATPFYTQPPSDTTWDTEAKKLLEVLKTI
jgi:glycosyltransferase involved in cell wall biosynthesis